MIKNRILNLQEILNDSEAFLVTSGSNRFYLTGFNSSAGTVVITKTRAVFFIDFRYFEKAKSTAGSCEVVLYDKGDKGIYEFCKSEKIKCIFVESSFVSLTQHKHLSDLFSGIEISKDNLLDLSINKMRAVKSADELLCIKQAQALTDSTFDYILPRITAGRTEREVMLDMEFFMRGLGASGVSFDFIVVSGKNSSLPHGVPTDKKIEKGDFVTMDFGALYNGYCSDMTRTVALGFVTDQMKEVYETVLAAQLAGIGASKAGVLGSEVDGAARKVIADAGYGAYFGHGYGHSLGLQIHEAPNCNPGGNVPMPVKSVCSAEPGIYLPDQFGVRIEDVVIFEENGVTDITKSPKELIIL